MPTGPSRITGLQFDPEVYSSEHDVSDPELKVSSAFALAICVALLFSFINLLPLFPSATLGTISKPENCKEEE